MTAVNPYENRTCPWFHEIFTGTFEYAHKEMDKRMLKYERLGFDTMGEIHPLRDGADTMQADLLFRKCKSRRRKRR